MVEVAMAEVATVVGWVEAAAEGKEGDGTEEKEGTEVVDLVEDGVVAGLAAGLVVAKVEEGREVEATAVEARVMVERKEAVEKERETKEEEAKEETEAGKEKEGTEEGEGMARHSRNYNPSSRM